MYLKKGPTGPCRTLTFLASARSADGSNMANAMMQIPNPEKSLLMLMFLLPLVAAAVKEEEDRLDLEEQSSKEERT